LNRLITARLPLCAPPHTDFPLLYVVGFKRFAKIYQTFEEVLDSICQHGDIDSQASINEVVGCGIETALRAIHLPRLYRSQRLRSDISLLERRLVNEAASGGIFQDSGPMTQNFVARISQITSEKPHVILAYTWVMYMALFNGGRWRRSQLLNAGGDFWTGGAYADRLISDQSTCHSCLSFWFFDGSRDGEDIKEDFEIDF
jgi:hypothetical protein